MPPPLQGKTHVLGRFHIKSSGIPNRCPRYHPAKGIIPRSFRRWNEWNESACVHPSLHKPLCLAGIGFDRSPQVSFHASGMNGIHSTSVTTWPGYAAYACLARHSGATAAERATRRNSHRRELDNVLSFQEDKPCGMGAGSSLSAVHVRESTASGWD